MKHSRTTLAPPVPELPVEDVERAQQHYRDALGFEIAWLDPGKEIGAVSRGKAAIFFRKRNRPFEPAVHWIFAAKIDATATGDASFRIVQQQTSRRFDRHQRFRLSDS